MWSRGAVLRMVHADSWFKWLEDFLISHSLYLPKNNPNTKPKFCFTILSTGLLMISTQTQYIQMIQYQLCFIRILSLYHQDTLF